MALTWKHLFRPWITTQYPEEKLTVSRRLRGNELIWSQKKCTGCATCAKSCPHGAIEIVTSTAEDNTYIVEKFEVDSGYCIFCGLCVESCPYDALFLSYDYEKSRYRRQEVVKAKENLIESELKQASGYGHPEIEKRLPKQTLLLERDEVKK
jgi:NAD(P)H-quinone oxidoreductase subunit I